MGVTKPTAGKLLAHYVKKQALFAMLFAVLGLWLLQVVFSYLSELENLSDTYDFVDALSYIVYRSPYFLEQFMPTGALLGAVVGLGLLANHSELIVMRSAGVSLYRLVWWVLQPALLFVLIGLLVNQFVLPKTNLLADQIRDPEASLLTSVTGYWTVQTYDDRPQRDVIYIDYADANGKLGGVKRWRIDANNNITHVANADSGTFTAANEQSMMWQLNQVTLLDLQPLIRPALNQASQTTTQTLLENQQRAAALIQNEQPFAVQRYTDSLPTQLPISPTSVHLLTRAAEDLSLTELYEYKRFNDLNQTRSLEHELAFWQKLLSPFAILSLVVVACSFVFGSLRTHSLGLRVVVALLFGLLFSYLQDLVGFISLATGVSPLLMVLLPIAASTVLGIYLLKKQG